MANVSQGVFSVTKKYVDESNNVLMFDWKMEYAVEGAITPLESNGVEIVADGSGLTVGSSDADYEVYLKSTKIGTFFDDQYEFICHQADFHLIRETATEVAP